MTRFAPADLQANHVPSESPLDTPVPSADSAFLGLCGDALNGHGSWVHGHVVALLRIDEMPRRLRPILEHYQLTYLPTHSTWTVPGREPWGDGWFTRWLPDPGGNTVSCRQALGARSDEIVAFRAAVDELAATEGFEASITIPDPA